jgi:hypothetical protein
VLSGSIQPGQYYLVQEAQGNAGTTALPAADASGGINLSATDGKLALVSNSTTLSGTVPSGSQIVDFVGYGTANASEGSPAGALTNTTAAFPQSGGCTDTNNNRADFTTSSPSPRNSHSALNPCSPSPTNCTCTRTTGMVRRRRMSPDWKQHDLEQPMSQSRRRDQACRSAGIR